MKVKNVALDSFATTASGMKLSAELVTLGGRNGSSYTHSAVVAALTEAGLDPKAAREFQPRNAWSRACRQLAKERIIDVVREDNEEALFQFSKRFLAADASEGGQEIQYRKEVKILLDKASGKLRCKDPDILQLAQRELDRCMQARTNGDVTAIAQRIFNAHADLMPLPGAVGVYLVPIAHRDFLRKVEKFLNVLGRKPHILPVPAGVEESDRTVQETVAEYLQSLIADHLAAVEGFSESTRKGTFENAVERINETRVKVEAYALYLQDRKDELLAAVNDAREKLKEAVERLAKPQEEAPAEPVQEEPEQPEYVDEEHEDAELEVAF